MSWFRIIALISLIGLTGCAHSIHLVHTSDFTPGVPIESGEMVKGYAEQFVIMGFTSDTDYVESATRKLMAACPNGAITGITTQISTSLGFFSWTNKALLQGLCIRSSKQAAR